MSQNKFFSLAKALGGIPILGTLPGTPAARAGLQYGDVLLTIDGQPMASIGDYIEFMKSRGENVLATIFRGGLEREVLLEFNGPRRRCWDAASTLEYLLCGDQDETGSPVLN